MRFDEVGVRAGFVRLLSSDAREIGRAAVEQFARERRVVAVGRVHRARRRAARDRPSPRALRFESAHRQGHIHLGIRIVFI